VDSGLVLAWLYEHRLKLADPLGDVESVYADFDYPEEMSRFVRYMPSDDPDLRDHRLNQARIFGKWEQYLRQAQEQLSRR